jgi:dihydrodipicolinate synthase/N-acetylneuraminate lyase
MMTGTDNNLPAALKAGMGAILASGNVLTKQVAAVFAAHRQGKDIAWPFAKLSEASQLVLGARGAPGIKYALGELGLRESFVRPPQVDLTAEQKAQLKPQLAELAQLV